MKKILSLLLIVTSITYGAQKSKIDTKIQLPSAEILEQQLRASKLDHFIQHGRIIQKLANKKLRPNSILMVLSQAVHMYLQTVANKEIPFPHDLFLTLPFSLIKCIFQDHDDVIKEFENNGFIQLKNYLH